MLHISNLNVSYGSRCVISALGLSLAPGTLCAVTGANGSGKSTLLSAISGVIPEHINAEVTGNIYLSNTDLRSIALREKYNYLWHALSDSDAQFFFPTCEAELAFALENMGLPSAEIKHRIEAAAAYFGLSGVLSSSPITLSCGQKRLLLLAIGMALDPLLYLLDEPASGLSGKSLALLCRWLEDLKLSGKVVLVAEHNPKVISMADHVVCLGEQDR